MPPSGTSEPTDRSASPQVPAAEKLAMSTDPNVGPSRGKKPAWNVPSGTASSESVGPIMDATAWPALGGTSRASPKSSSTASSASTDSLKSLSEGSAVSAPAVRVYTSSSETVVAPVPQPPRPNPTPNLTRRGSTGSENTHSPQPNNRSSRWVHGPNRRGNNNNNNNNNYHNNNNGGGFRGRERGGAHWNSSWNNSPRPPNFYRGNQAVTTPPPPPAVAYRLSAPAIYPPYFPQMGYGLPYPMFGNVPMGDPQIFTQIAPSGFYLPGELELREAILKQIDYYFSNENLCTDFYLRKNMDDQGWVPVSVIANFNRVKQMTSDLQFILDILNYSTVVEVQGDKLRSRQNWMTWVLPSPRLETVSSQIQGLNIGPAAEISSHI